jgi:hypothetical protein
VSRIDIQSDWQTGAGAPEILTSLKSCHSSTPLCLRLSKQEI